MRNPLYNLSTSLNFIVTGLGRGDTFAKASDGGRGTLDWKDVETMIDAAISQGIVDPDRMGIAGYSNGGYLAAWGCTRPNSRFKVGVVGAGISDWGFLASSSDMPDMEVSCGHPGIVCVHLTFTSLIGPSSWRRSMAAGRTALSGRQSDQRCSKYQGTPPDFARQRGR